MVLVIAAAVLAVVLLVALISTTQSAGRGASRRTSLPRESRLPTGADAALWSIVEAVPDPRNHLALTRDLTGEVRITGTILDTGADLSSDLSSDMGTDVATLMDDDIDGDSESGRAAVMNTITPPPRPTPAGGASVRIIGRIGDAVDDGPAEDPPLEVAS